MRVVSCDKYSTWLCVMLYLSINPTPSLYFPYIAHNVEDDEGPSSMLICLYNEHSV